MKVIKYSMHTTVNRGTEDEPEWIEVMTSKTMPYSEANEAIAQSEAYNEEYVVEDDGTSEPGATIEERLDKIQETVDGIVKSLSALIGK